MNYVLLYCFEDYSFVTHIIMCTARIARREIQGRYDNILKGEQVFEFRSREGEISENKTYEEILGWWDKANTYLRYASNIFNFLLKNVNGSLVLKREPFVSKNALSLFITDEFSSLCLCLSFGW